MKEGMIPASKLCPPSCLAMLLLPQNEVREGIHLAQTEQGGLPCKGLV